MANTSTIKFYIFLYEDLIMKSGSNFDNMFLTQILNDIFPVYVENIQRSFPDASLAIYTDLTIPLQNINSCEVHCCENISSNDMFAIISHRSDAECTILLNASYPLVKKDSIQQLLQSSENCFLYYCVKNLTRHTLKTSKTSQILRLFGDSIIPAVTIKHVDSSINCSCKMALNSHEYIAPRTISDLVLIKTQLVIDRMKYQEGL